MTLEYRQALSEISVVLKYMDEKYTKAIPEKIITFINNNKDKNYISKIDLNKPINEQPLKEDTRVLLALFYEKYWCTEENRKLNMQRKKMVKTKLDRKALKEVYEILMLLNQEELEKIPQEIFESIKNNCDMTYEIDISNIEENMLPDTQKILAMIYTNYLASKEEKEVIGQISLLEEKNKNASKSYASDEIKTINIEELKKETEKIDENEKLMLVKKENFISTLLNKIKNWVEVNLWKK